MTAIGVSDFREILGSSLLATAVNGKAVRINISELLVTRDRGLRGAEIPIQPRTNRPDLVVAKYIYSFIIMMGTSGLFGWRPLHQGWRAPN